MGFQFSLATVLRFRESVEQREEFALQQVQMQIAQTQRAVDELTGQILQAQQARENAMREPVPAAHLQAMVQAAEAAAEQKKVLLTALEKLEKLRIERMQAYQAAHRDRQTLSEMKGRQRDVYDLERARQQQRFLDDNFAARLQRE